MKINSKYSKAGVGYIIGNILVRGIGFLTIPLFARVMSTTDFGVFNTYTSYEAILFIIMGLALNTSFKNANIKFKEKFDDYVSSCILEATFVLFFFVVGAYLVFGCIGIDKPDYLIVLLFHGFASAIIAYYNAYLAISYKSKEYVKYAVFIALGNVLLSMGLMLSALSDNKGLARILGSAIPNILIAVYIVILFWHKCKPKIVKEYIRFSLAFSIPLIPHGISQVLLSTFDRIMITKMVGESETGIYSFACTIYSIIAVIFASLNQVFEPWFYEKMELKKYNDIRNVSLKYMRIALYMTIIIMLVSPEMVKILGSAKYDDSIELVVPITIGGFFSFLYGFPAIVEYYYEKTKCIAVATAGAATLNILLNYIFIPKIGYEVAAYTTLFTYFVYFIAHYIISNKLLSEQLYQYKDMVQITAILLGSGVVIQFLLKCWMVRWSGALFIGILLIRYLLIEFELRDKVFNIIRHK